MSYTEIEDHTTRNLCVLHGEFLCVLHGELHASFHVVHPHNVKKLLGITVCTSTLELEVYAIAKLYTMTWQYCS